MPADDLRRRRWVLVAVVLLAFGGLRLLRGRGETAGTESLSALSRSSPAEGEVLVLGSLRLSPCDVGKVGLAGSAHAWCGRVEVPEDWSRADRHGAGDGRRIGLRVAVVPARAARAERDVLVFLDGGPGGSAVDDYPGLADAFHHLRERRHLLLVDQRGTGGSNELRCDPAHPDAEADRKAREEAQRQGVERDQIDKAALHRSLRECLARLTPRADPAQYTTQAAVRDLEAVRQAIGAPPLDLVGVSYGTRVAQQYAAAHPEAVRAVVLDSPVPNQNVLGSEIALNLDAALKARFEVCRQNPACAARFGDPYASMYRLRDRLRDHPEEVVMRDPVTFAPLSAMVTAADLAVTARLFAYLPALSALLPLTIDEALHGHFAPLLGQRKLIVDAVNEQLTDGVGLSVSCADDADLLTPRPEDRKLLLGDAMVQYVQAACEVWPRGSRDPHLHDPWRSAVPTLILVGEFDPITPPRYGEEVRRGLSNARLLLLRGQGHSLMRTGCMPRLLGEFIRAPGTASLDAGCLDALGDTPAFLGYSGAAP